MSSIKDLLQEEDEAERQVKEAEQKAEALIRDAKSTAREILKRAQTDDVEIARLSEESKQRILQLKTKEDEEFQVQFAETENRYKKNLDDAARLIMSKVLGF